MKFFLFLLIVFTVEVAIMDLLPGFVPPGSHRFVSAVVDATFLSLVIAPVTWWLFVVPLKRRHAERGRLLERILTAQEEERASVVRDLHDGLGQSLTALLVRLRVLGQQTVDPLLHEQVEALRTITADAASELRRMVREARPPVLDDLGLCAALARKIEELAGVALLQVDLDCQLGDPARLPSQLETAVYRVVVESVNNVIKHAAAEKLQVRLCLEKECLRGDIVDDGCGFQLRRAGRSAGVGLASMRERCEAVGGVVTVESQPRRGTRVRFAIPVPKLAPEVPTTEVAAS